MEDTTPNNGPKARGLPLRGGLKALQPSSGVTMVELMISVMILTLCCGMLTSMLTSTGLHGRTNRDRAVAAEAARGVLEDMHNCEFRQTFAMYNDDPADDPGVPGSAPGKHFAVEGLTPQDGDVDGFVGEILLPASSSPLLETVEDPSLTMPRDLNGDMKVDALDHTGDHIILPVRVVLRWKGQGGDRTFELHTMLANLEKL